jgi:uncharacterized membrane protein
MARSASPYLLAAVLFGAGALHFVMPKPYDDLIPSWLPGSARSWVYGSGVVELAAAVGVAVPRTRRVAATGTALLFVAVFPGNIEMAVHPGDTPRWLALARLPLQIPLVLWALQVRRAAQSTRRSVKVR